MQKLNNQQTPKHLSEWRLNSFDEIKKLKEHLGTKSWSELTNEVYSNLNSIKPGSQFNFSKHYQGNKLIYFIKIACMYITEHADYSMSENYTDVKRHMI